MSPGGKGRAIIGINWASSYFRALLIDNDGAVLDETRTDAGVIGLDRAGMAATIEQVVARWPDADAIYASGMIGSALGWMDVPYCEAPADAGVLLAGAAAVPIGQHDVMILPGVACRRTDGAPDVMRGEEVELLGLATREREGLAVLPGAHTKWVRLDEGRIGAFVTSMSGEIYDRLSAQGLLASIVMDEARAGDAFDAGLDVAARGGSLGVLLFGARAKVMRGDLAKADAASYLRGVLIGAEIADAIGIFGALTGCRVLLVGETTLTDLYAAALARAGAEVEVVDARRACASGFALLHATRHG